MCQDGEIPNWLTTIAVRRKARCLIIDVSDISSISRTMAKLVWVKAHEGPIRKKCANVETNKMFGPNTYFLAENADVTGLVKYQRSGQGVMAQASRLLESA